MSIILGIDPGSRKTGYGIIETMGNQHRYVASGVIRLGDGPLPGRLKSIFDHVTVLIREYQPQEVAIEEVFMAKSAGSALKLGQARGAAVTACVVSDLIVAEYTARQIKQAVVGTGAAVKEQVQHMVRLLLNLSANPQEDAADALAAALCHANARKGLMGMKDQAPLRARMKRGRLG